MLISHINMLIHSLYTPGKTGDRFAPSRSIVIQRDSFCPVFIWENVIKVVGMKSSKMITHCKVCLAMHNVWRTVFTRELPSQIPRSRQHTSNISPCNLKYLSK